MALAQANAVRLPLADKSVHCGVTSPPYYNLRLYEGIEPQVWGDGWYGCLGNEPSPEMFIVHLIEVGREMWRVLRDDGVWFINLGDSYANDTKWGGRSGKKNYTSAAGQYRGQREKRSTGLKPKDKMLIPARAALALQADGWIIRQDMPWMKTNPLPDSTTDRPGVAHEYVFVLTKSSRAYWDAEAVKRVAVGSGGGGFSRSYAGNQPGHGAMTLERPETDDFRQYRTTDPWCDSLDMAIAQAHVNLAIAQAQLDHLLFIQDAGGLLVNETGEPLALYTSLTGYSGAHFATFPVALVLDFIKAATSAKGCCSKCGKQWVRVVQTPDFSQQPRRKDNKLEGQMLSKGSQYLTSAGQAWQEWRKQNPNVTTGWRPACGCNQAGPDLRPDDLDIIASPTGGRAGSDPSLTTGRAGLNRPRAETEGQRPITRYEQRVYAAQLRRSPHRAEMEAEAGMEAFKHYLRKDASGARPVPPMLLDQWLERGWIKRVQVPAFEPYPVVPAIVIDPFCGSGTVGEACGKLGRRFVGMDLSARYLAENAAARADKRTTEAGLEAARRSRGRGRGRGNAVKLVQAGQMRML